MFDFKTKEEYLIQKTEWKKEYKKLSKEIRNMKNERRELHKTNQYSWQHATALINAKDLATNMLQEYADAKIEANRQYLEQKGTV